MLDQLTLFAEGHRASLPAAPGSGEARKMIVGSGEKCCELYEMQSRHGASLKMFVDSLVLKGDWFSRICYLKWKVKATKSNRLLFQLAVSMPRIKGTESGLWQTPTVEDAGRTGSAEGWKKYIENGQTSQCRLRNQVQMWPTPTAADHYKGNLRSSQQKPGSRHSLDLPSAAKLWPTPRANDAEKRGNFDVTNPRNGLPAAVKIWPTPTVTDSKNNAGPSQFTKGQGGRNLNVAADMFPTPTTGAGHCGGTGHFQQLHKLKEQGVITEEERRNMSQGNGGQLNPEWVEWLMGYPKGWTDIGTQSQTSPE